MLKTMWKLWKARRRKARALRTRHLFIEGVDHERRRVRWLLESMAVDHGTLERRLPGADLGHGLAWTDGWLAAQERALDLVNQMAHRLPAEPDAEPDAEMAHVGLMAPGHEYSPGLHVVPTPTAAFYAALSPEQFAQAEHDLATSAGDAKCGYCGGPMPCYCTKPAGWDSGDDEGSHGDPRISSDRTPV